MPNFRKHWTRGFGRNLRLSLGVEASLTGVGAITARLKARLPGRKTALTKPTAPSPTAQIVRTGQGVAAPENLAQARNMLAKQDQKLKHVRHQLAKERKERQRLRTKLDRSEHSADGSNHSVEDPPTFFIVGRAKSGTSWLMRILNAHPEILCTGEGRFFGRSYLREDFNKAQVKLQPKSLYGAIVDSEYLRVWVERSPWTRDGDTEEHLVELTRLATKHFLAQRLSRSRKWIVGDKTPFTSEEMIEEIARIMPDAKVIHIIRDGRDVAISSMHHVWNFARDKGGQNELGPEVLDKRDRYRAEPEAFGWGKESIFARGQLAGTAKNWAALVERARKDGSALLRENYVEVLYEDLLERPEEQIGRILRFLGADDDDETVKRCIESASFEAWTKGRKRGQEDFTAFLRKGVAGDWSGVFTEQDRQIFKEVAGDLLIKLGYEESNLW
jgi:hypothetical protein